MSFSSSRKCEACASFQPCPTLKRLTSAASPKHKSMQGSSSSSTPQSPSLPGRTQSNNNNNNTVVSQHEQNNPSAGSDLPTLATDSQQSQKGLSKKKNKKIPNNTEPSKPANPPIPVPAPSSQTKSSEQQKPATSLDSSATFKTVIPPPPKISQTESPVIQQEAEKSEKGTEKIQKEAKQSTPTAPPPEEIAVTRAHGEHPATLAHEEQPAHEGQSAVQAHEKQPAAQEHEEQTATKSQQDKLQSQPTTAVPTTRKSLKTPNLAKKMSLHIQDLPYILTGIANVTGIFLYWAFGLIRTYMNAYPALKIAIYLGLALCSLPIGIFIAFLVGCFVMLAGAATIVVLALSGSAAVGGLIFLGPIVLGIAGLASVVAGSMAMTDWVGRMSGWLMYLMRMGDDSSRKGKLRAD